MNRKIEDKTTKQIVIDIGLHQLVKIKAAKARRTIRELVEDLIVEDLGTDYQSYYDKKKNK